MKRWTQREARAGGALSPDALNDEIRGQQSSITTLDREQLPSGWVGSTHLKAGALHRVWAASALPSGGEQTTHRDQTTPDSSWGCVTIPVSPGGWQSIGTATIAPFLGGSLFVEWSANTYAQNIFALGVNDGSPGSPNYVGMRILANGVTIAERQGGAYHQSVRVVGSAPLPAGPVTLDFQWRFTPPSEDAAITTSGGNTVPYAHIWNSRYLAIGRWK